jgi:GNAT superfamily N-acetyltransferase
MSGVFSEIELYNQYLSEQKSGKRSILAAFFNKEIAGYLTIVWESEYLPFRNRNIPEIKDLRILPRFRRKKVAARLMNRAEKMISDQSNLAGIGVGLYSDYGPAQKLYIMRGYVPDGNGLCYKNVPVEPGMSVMVDDELTLQMIKLL